MRRSGLVLACLLAATGAPAADFPDPPDPATLAIPPGIDAKARRLVAQLGSPDFAERDAASDQLAGLGRLARPALLAGALGPDPEVRARCEKLLPRATTLDVRAKLLTFLADTDGRYEHDLPGWKAFRAAVCDRWTFCGYPLWSNRSLEAPARRTFADLFAVPAHRKMLSVVDASPGELAVAAAERRVELYPPRSPRDRWAEYRVPTVAEVAVLLFAESRVPRRVPPLRTSMSNMIRSSGFADAARGDDDTGRVYRALAAAWLDSVCDPREMYSSLSTAWTLNLPETACRLSARLLGAPGVSAMYRGRAASTLIESGGKEHVPLLARAATDESVFYTLQVTGADGDSLAGFDVQVRDVALAVGVLLTGQRLTDYGFTDRYGENLVNEAASYSYTRYYFADDAARKRAFAKWAEWQKANPSGPPVAPFPRPRE